MATKKQKRAAAEAKHEAFMEEIRMSGLEALRKDREYRAKKNLQAWQENHDKNHSWKKLIPECPHCQLMKKHNAPPITPTKIPHMTAVPGASTTHIKESI